MNVRKARIQKAFSRAALANAGVLLLSITVSLVLAEFVLRQLCPVKDRSSSTYRIPHPVFGWALQAGASYLNCMPEDTIRVTYSVDGWRDVPRAVERRSGEARLLVLGDSFMEAYSVRFEDAFHMRLEEYLDTKHAEAEVLNMGVGGFGTLQEYLVFRNAGRLYNPDIVLLGFYMGNDVRNNSAELEAAVHDGSMKVDSRPFLISAHPWRTTVVDYAGARQRYAAAMRRRKTLLGRLRAASALMYRAYEAVDWLDMKLTDDSESTFLAMHGTAYCQEPRAITAAWKVTGQILERLWREVEEAGGTLVVFCVPAMHHVDPEEKAELAATTQAAAKLCLEQAPAYRRLSRMADSLGIAYIDLLPAFRTATEREGAKLYRSSDRHWNEAGHALAAATVGGYLVEHDLLPDPRPAPH